MDFYDSDPENGGEKIAFWDFLEQSGVIKFFRSKGMVINPTHNYQMLKDTREEIFNKSKTEFLNNRGLNKLTTTESDISAFRIIWLEDEKSICEKWLVDNGNVTRNPTSNQIELNKYLNDINLELIQIRHPKCTSTAFKKDLSELCLQCPLRDTIPDMIEKQIKSGALERKEVLNKAQFSKYLEKEIDNAQEIMDEVILAEQQNQTIADDKLRHNRIETYIWNKERLKVLRKFQLEDDKVCDETNYRQETKTNKDKETPTFINNFDKIKPFEIHKHFKEGLVEKGYLTEKELNEYLKAAFEYKKIPETLFKIKDSPKKAAIEAVFYKYYKNVAGKVHGKQSEYAALLGDYFEGFKTSTVSSNFSKSVY